MSNIKKRFYRKPVTNASQLVLWRDSYVSWFNGKDIDNYGHLAKSLAVGKTIFVRKDILDIATSVDITSISSQDILNCLPSKEGFLCLEGSPSWSIINKVTGEIKKDRYQISGLHWYYESSTEKLYLTIFVPPKLKMSLMSLSGTVSREDKKAFIKAFGDGMFPQKTIARSLRSIKFQVNSEYPGLDLFISLISLLSSDSLVKREIHSSSNDIGRVKTKGKKNVNSVSIVSLRSLREVRSTTYNDTRLSVRFIVSGHFRNQWYPGEGIHKRIFIDPYIKGPEDAPLKMERPVYLF